MFWILKDGYSQDWGGELSSILCVTKEHEQYKRFDELFIEENGFGASGGYIVFEYSNERENKQVMFGFHCPVGLVYKNILDQIVKQQGAKVIDIRQFDYAGMV